MNTTTNLQIRGMIKISDYDTGEVLVDKDNQIHFENISEAIAYSFANKDRGYIFELHLGNGGTSVSSTGVINYLPPNVNTQNANLYNPTYYKIVDDTSLTNPNPQDNRLEIRHVPGQVFSDIYVTCLLDYGEPAGQSAFDNSANLDDTYTFDELGLKARSTDGSFGLETTGKLLTHAVFHPVQKSLNRRIKIEYTVRIQTLTNLSSLTG